MSDEEDGGAVGKIQVLTPEQLGALNQAKVRPCICTIFMCILV